MTTTPKPRGTQAHLAEVRGELARADQKAATLLALVSAISAGIIAGFATKKEGIFSLWNGVEWMAWIGVFCLAGSVAQLLYCVRPGGVSRLTGNAYFAYYAQYAGRPDALAVHLSTTANEELEQCGLLVDLSVLATRKYRRIARAVDFLGGSLILVAGAMLLDCIR
ncbi:Pycsar system effector family protein [Streptomyces albogriseolus]|uniref:Pycsar system effector family protein n=1 Tax=Streptomyces albogriseolus TaxID=1887 RepID=UPI0034616472